ncbi:MAG: TRAP transporter permease DctQ [Rhodothermaceae bacterium]|nr:TRAP transporter permease DctQ [Rhodothermaceae bacterium]
MRTPLLRATADGGVKGAVDRVLAWACVALMGASVLNVTWQVVTRFVLGRPSGFTDELARFLLIWLGLLGAAYAVGQRMHLAIDLLPRALADRPRARAALGIVLQGCVLVFAGAVMVYGGGNLVRLTTLLGQRSAALGVSLGAVYSVLPVAGTVIAFYAVHAMGTYVAVLRGLRPGAPPPDGTSAETFAAHQPGIDLPEPRPDAP